MQLKDQEEELDDLAAQVQAQTRYTGTGRAAKIRVEPHRYRLKVYRMLIVS